MYWAGRSHRFKPGLVAKQRDCLIHLLILEHLPRTQLLAFIGVLHRRVKCCPVHGFEKGDYSVVLGPFGYSYAAPSTRKALILLGYLCAETLPSRQSTSQRCHSSTSQPAGVLHAYNVRSKRERSTATQACCIPRAFGPAGTSNYDEGSPSTVQRRGDKKVAR